MVEFDHFSRRDALRLLLGTGATSGITGVVNSDPAVATHAVKIMSPSQVSKLTPDDGDKMDRFGWQIAVDGSTAIVGAVSDEDPNGTSGEELGGAGSAYVFTEVDGEWNQQAKLAPDDGDSRDAFGESIAICDSRALISAPVDEDPNGTSGERFGGAGSAYIFTETDDEWRQQAKLAPDDGDSEDLFGQNVDLDGSTAVIGASYDEHPHGVGSGSAYVFAEVDGEWRQQAKLTPDDGDRNDRFGVTVAISGQTVLISAGDDEDPNGENSGSAYIFTEADGEWRQQAKLIPDDGDSGDGLGTVALSGSTAILGASNDEDPNGEGAGSAYVFTETDGEWRQQTKLTPDDGDSEDNFGALADLDGRTAIIGASNDEDPNGEGAGSAYVFTETDGEWRQQAKLIPDDGDSGDNFGSVAVSGSTALVGADSDEDPNGEMAGSAYVFDLGDYSGINEPPSASFEAEPTSAVVGEPVTFDASASSDPDGSITRYAWDFDGDSTIEVAGSSATVTHTFDVSGEQTVRLTVTDDSGEAATTTRTITVESDGGSGDGITVGLAPGGPTVSIDGTRSVDVVAAGANNGVATYDVELTVASGGIQFDSLSVAGSPSVSSSGVTDDGTTARYRVAGNSLAADEGSVTLGSVTIAGESEGEASVTTTVNGLGDGDGEPYEDVEGDTSTVTVTEDPSVPPVTGEGPPTDVDGDGQFEDVDGDGEFDIFDVQEFLEHFEGETVQNNTAAFNFDGSGEVDIFDVQALLDEL
jgi:PKD repeat protein